MTVQTVHHRYPLREMERTYAVQPPPPQVPEDLIRDYADVYGYDAVRYGFFIAGTGATEDDFAAGWRFLNRIWRMHFTLDDDRGGFCGGLDDDLRRDITDMAHYTKNGRRHMVVAVLRRLWRRVAGGDAGLRVFLIALYPVMPHIATALYDVRGYGDIATAAFDGAVYNPPPEAHVVIPVQVNGRRRGEIKIKRGAGRDDVIAAAGNIAVVQKHIGGKIVRDVIFVSNKVVNFVTADR